jgi:hypothetical protein
MAAPFDAPEALRARPIKRPRTKLQEGNSRAREGAGISISDMALDDPGMRLRLGMEKLLEVLHSLCLCRYSD